MNCSKCGRELPNGSTICAFCGNKNEVKSFFYSVKDDSPAEDNVAGRPYDNEPVRTESPKYELPRPEPARYEPPRPEPARYEPPRPEPARYEPPRPEPSRPEPARYEPPRPEPVRPGTTTYGTYPASSAAPAASKGMGAGTIVLIIAAVVLSLLAGIFALKFLVKDPIVGTWTATEAVDSGMTYTPEEAFGANVIATFNKDKTVLFKASAVSDYMTDETDGTWEKVEKGRYSVTINDYVYGASTATFYLEGNTLTWDINNGAAKIVFEK